MELNVKIHSIGQTQKVSYTFSKREFVVETQEDYKQYLLLQVVKDKCELLNNFKPGESVSVSLNFKGRLWTDANGVEKCFNTLECWKITKQGTESVPQNNSGAESLNHDSSDLPW